MFKPSIRPAAAPGVAVAIALAAAASFVVAPPTLAADPFVLTAETTSGTPSSVTASGHSLPDLVSNLITTRSEFASFDGAAFRASLDYAGVRNAIRFQQNAAGTSATVTIPSTGFSRTFTGSSETEVRDKIRDFLLKDGAKEYARFLRTVNERSLIGVTDGNPLAATAILSNTSFYRFGLQRSPFDAGGTIYAAPDGGGLRFDFGGGYANTDDGDGYFLAASLGSVIRFNRNVGLSLATPFVYREVEGAKVFTLGFEAALTVVLTAPSLGRGVTWQLTPSFLSGASGSVDLAAGGTFLGGGLTNSFAVPFGDSATITIGNGIYFYEGYNLHIADYEWDTDLSQQVLKNGIKFTQALGPGAFADVSITHTAFLQDAATQTYLTPGAGIGVRFGKTSGLRVAYQGDFADGFNSHGGTVTLFFNY
jgi:hypothetical protein